MVLAQRRGGLPHRGQQADQVSVPVLPERIGDHPPPGMLQSAVELTGAFQVLQQLAQGLEVALG